MGTHKGHCLPRRAIFILAQAEMLARKLLKSWWAGSRPSLSCSQIVFQGWAGLNILG